MSAGIMKSPMLAASTDGKGLKFPLLASPKLDGVRALVLDGKVVSRKFKLIPNLHIQRMLGHAKYNGLDGELIAGDPTDPEAFRRTMKAVMTAEGEPDVTFHVFDDCSKTMHGFSARLESVFRRLASASLSIAYVTHCTVQTEEQLTIFEELCLARGYEGVMLRHPSGLYKEGRSTLKEAWLLKLKRFADSEAEVLGYSEMQHNANEKTITSGGKAERSHNKAGLVGLGVLGALHVKDCVTGVEFAVGSGFTAADREIYWALRDELLGRFAKYQFFPLGSKDKPRFPTFKGFRDPIDF